MIFHLWAYELNTRRHTSTLFFLFSFFWKTNQRIKSACKKYVLRIIIFFLSSEFHETFIIKPAKRKPKKRHLLTLSFLSSFLRQTNEWKVLAKIRSLYNYFLFLVTDLRRILRNICYSTRKKHDAIRLHCQFLVLF